jgi:hypothetical protein
MKSTCRAVIRPTWRTRQLAVAELLRQATVVSDPVRLAYLNAKVAESERTSEGNVPHRITPAAVVTR